MIDLRHVGGSAVINLMRGIGGLNQGSSGKLLYNHRCFNLYLPSLSTIKAYLEPLDLQFGIDLKQIEQVKHVCWQLWWCLPVRLGRGASF